MALAVGRARAPGPFWPGGPGDGPGLLILFQGVQSMGHGGPRLQIEFKIYFYHFQIMHSKAQGDIGLAHGGPARMAREMAQGV